jgi:peptidoglycan-associated lipoprotein
MKKQVLISTAALLSAVSTNAYAQDQPATTPAEETTTQVAPAPESTTVRVYEDTSDTATQGSRTVVRAPKNAFEISVEGGYTQPFGKIDSNNNIADIADAGGAAGLTLAYRINPHWSIGATGQFHGSSPDTDVGVGTDIGGVAAGLLATLHILPFSRVDPYVSLGTGYRVMWIAPPGPDNNDMVHGFEAGRAILGVDFRASKDVAIGPMVGADVNVFLWNDPQGGTNQRLAGGVQPSTFIFAGAAARFDIGGTRVPHNEVAITFPAAQPAAAPPAPRPVEPPAPPAAPPAAEEPGETGVRIQPEILETCKIEESKAFFRFDSAKLQNTDLSTLDAVATCFTSGPLKGRNLQIVGHADPRGTDKYNMMLGESRGQTVQKYLSAHGMTNINVISHGEQDATGTDENGWAYDRRVDLNLE